jgi:hypothetical protein
MALIDAKDRKTHQELERKLGSILLELMMMKNYTVVVTIYTKQSSN